MKRIILVLLALILPMAASAASKEHMKTDQDCAECHAGQEQVWLDGKHGMMGVKCVVCHGSPDKNFVAKPALTRCRGCHSAEVATVEAKLPVKDRTCFLCHDNHKVVVKDSAKSKAGFHGQGGAK